MADASIKLSEVIVKGMQEKKALDIVVMDLREVKNAVADFFVICSGNSDKHLASISQSVDDEVSKNLQEDPWSKEGKHNKEWMLLDYVTVVVHIFKRERREFYSLETLWGDAVLKKIKDDPSAVYETDDDIEPEMEVKPTTLRGLVTEANKESLEAIVDRVVIEAKKELSEAKEAKTVKLVKPKAIERTAVTKMIKEVEKKAAKKVSVKKVGVKKVAAKKVKTIKKTKGATKPTSTKTLKKVKAVKVVKKVKAVKKVVVKKASKKVKKK